MMETLLSLENQVRINSGARLWHWLPWGIQGSLQILKRCWENNWGKDWKLLDLATWRSLVALVFFFFFDGAKSQIGVVWGLSERWADVVSVAGRHFWDTWLWQGGERLGASWLMRMWWERFFFFNGSTFFMKIQWKYRSCMYKREKESLKSKDSWEGGDDVIQK